MSSLRRFRLVMIYLAIVLATVACSSKVDSDNNGEQKLKVTSTIGMITDAVKNVGGDYVEVTGLMKEGTDPHTYKVTQGDIRRLEDADVIFYNGLFLEAQMGEILDAMSSQKPTIAVGERLDPAQLIALLDDDSGGEYDPHVWFDVTLWMQVVEVIRDELIEHDPAHADQYRQQAEDYLEQLRELHQYVHDRMNEIPEQSKYLITAHDAFGYFGRAYGIEVIGLQGISTASEVGLKDVSDLRDFMIENNIKAIFYESSVNRDRIDSIITGAKAKGHEIKEGGELFSDAMGPAGTPEGTYIGMVRHNVDTIVNALK